ncbi:MAG: hypothetical protein LBJ32_01400 [Oscillospiraceae bacterium]|jgi:V/A-type H+-transporting ATPase subunit I|nr:hypothetical protein [Oscillospiraceae bacterium]
MAIVEMKLVNIIGTVEELDSVVSILGESGIFEPDNAFKIFKNMENFSLIEEENKIEPLINNLKESCKKIGKKLKKNSLDISNLNRRQIVKYISFFFEKTEKIFNKINILKTDLKRCQNLISNFEHYEKGLDASLSELFSCKYVEIKFGKILKKDFEKNENINDNLAIIKLSELGEFFYCIVFIAKSIFQEGLEILSNIGFKNIEIPNSGGKISEEIKKLKFRCSLIEQKIKELNEKLNRFWEHQEKYCSEVFARLEQFNKFYQIKLLASSYKDNFILSGWIPANETQNLINKLDHISRVEFSLESGNEILEFNPPTKLKNKKIFSSFEFFVTMYGLPRYSEIDPTIFVAITYIILFGIMFADAGQGLILTIMGYIASKFKKMKLGGAISLCGVSSIVFGMIFDSVFGFENIINPLYSFFGLKFKPIAIEDSTITVIFLAIFFGVILISISMIINVFSSIKRKRAFEAMFSRSGISGLIFYLSLIFSLLDLVFLKSGIFGIFFLITNLIVPLLLMFFKDMFEKKSSSLNWGEYVLNGSFELLEIILNYFTNTVSFVRIAVFMFVHSGMMMVVFSIANMLGKFAPIVIILGNIVVICLEALLVGIQVMRLEFCEMFSKFFAGGGRPFKPIK